MISIVDVFQSISSTLGIGPIGLPSASVLQQARSRGDSDTFASGQAYLFRHDEGSGGTKTSETINIYKIGKLFVSDQSITKPPHNPTKRNIDRWTKSIGETLEQDFIDEEIRSSILRAEILLIGDTTRSLNPSVVLFCGSMATIELFNEAEHTRLPWRFDLPYRMVLDPTSRLMGTSIQTSPRVEEEFLYSVKLNVATDEITFCGKTGYLCRTGTSSGSVENEKITIGGVFIISGQTYGLTVLPNRFKRNIQTTGTTRSRQIKQRKQISDVDDLQISREAQNKVTDIHETSSSSIEKDPSQLVGAQATNPKNNFSIVCTVGQYEFCGASWALINLPPWVFLPNSISTLSGTGRESVEGVANDHDLFPSRRSNERVKVSIGTSMGLREGSMTLDPVLLRLGTKVVEVKRLLLKSRLGTSGCST